MSTCQADLQRVVIAEKSKGEDHGGGWVEFVVELHRDAVKVL